MPTLGTPRTFGPVGIMERKYDAHFQCLSQANQCIKWLEAGAAGEDISAGASDAVDVCVAFYDSTTDAGLAVDFGEEEPV